MIKMIASAALMALSFSGGLRAQEMSNADTMVIMDVSNSMWGQIGGISKMEIARGVIGTLLNDIETESEFGLIAYGHRESNNCTDIEMVLPVAPLDGAQFSAAINDLQPRGRTPLTAAVEMAAEVMDSENRSARVILLTDGLESCAADPCALTAELEETGLDFTVHVIGFGVAAIEDQSQISCLAENTGGLYLTAENAAELTSALAVMSASEEPAEPTEQANILRVDAEGVNIDGPSKADANSEIEAIWAGPSNNGDYLAIALPSDPVTTFYDYARTSAGNPAALTTPETDGVYEIRYISPTGNDILATDLLVIGDIQIDLLAPERVFTGAAFTVSWEGPLLDGDALVLTTPNAAAQDIIAFGTATADQTISFTAPESAGDFEIQYQNLEGEILQTAALTVEYEATIDAPDDILAGAEILVNWTGPNLEADRIVIASLDLNSAEATNFGLTSDGDQLKILAPDVPGDYEIRYVLGTNGAIVAQKSLNLTQPEASISAEADAITGSEIVITWLGPNNQNDFLTVVPFNAPNGASENFHFARQGSPMTIQMPEEAGDYEIRYLTGQTSRTLTSTLITVAPEPTILTAEATAIAGSVVTINWEGPETADDLITIIQTGNEDDAIGNYTFTSEGPVIDIISEEFPGEYEIRYISGQTQEVLARLPLTLLPPPIEVTVQSEAVAGATISVEWIGPDAAEDYITIVPAGSDDSVDANYTYTRNGTPLDLITKDIAGEYEVRYISGETNETLTSSPITLTAPESSLTHDAAAVAGAEILVTWDGPNHTNDFITIVETGTPSGQYGNYTFTSRGAELAVLAPDIAGEYEVRYVTGQSYLTLSSQPLLLHPPQITIDARPVGTASTFLEVTWTGPSNQNDFLTVVPVGASDEALGAYQYTRKGNPLDLMLPEEAGSYEIRYVSGQSMRTLANLPLTILAQ